MSAVGQEFSYEYHRQQRRGSDTCAATMILNVALIITVASWLTPSPRYARGLIVNYGDQSLIEANALYRGYDLSPYPNRSVA